MISTTQTTQPYAFTPGAPPATFAIPFAYQQTSEIKATLSQSGLADVVLTQGVDYSVSAAPASSGTLTVMGPNWAGAYAAYGNVVVFRQTALINSMSIINGGDIDAAVLEMELDELTQMIQEASAATSILGKPLLFPLTDPSGVSQYLPDVATRASKFLSFDANGVPIEASGIPSVPVTAFMATVLDDTSAVMARSTLGVGFESYTPATGYTPALGDVVELNYDGTIRKAKRINSATLNAGTVVAARAAKLDATHFCVLLAVGLQISAEIWEVDPNTLLPSRVAAGTNVFLCTTTLGSFDVAPIDSTHVLVGYTATGGTATQLSVVTLTCNTGTGAITINTPVNGAAAAMGVRFSSIPGGTNTFMAYQASTTSLAGAVVSVSGVVPTINTPSAATVSAMSSMGGTTSSLGLSVNANGTTATCLYCGGATLAFSVCWTISGTTASAGAEVATAMNQTNMFFHPQLSYGKSNDYPVAFIGDFTSGNAPGSQGLTTLIRKATNALYLVHSRPVPVTGLVAPSGMVKALSDWVFAISWATQGGVSGVRSNHVVLARKRGGGAGNIFDFGDEITLALQADTNVVAQDAKEWLASEILVHIQPSATAGGTLVLTIKRRNTILGIAVDSAGTVQRYGTVSGLSGLVVGAVGVDDNGDLSSTVGEVKIGMAPSATVLNLNVVPGV